MHLFLKEQSKICKGMKQLLQIKAFLDIKNLIQIPSLASEKTDLESLRRL